MSTNEYNWIKLCVSKWEQLSTNKHTDVQYSALELHPNVSCALSLVQINTALLTLNGFKTKIKHPKITKKKFQCHYVLYVCK